MGNLKFLQVENGMTILRSICHSSIIIQKIRAACITFPQSIKTSADSLCAFSHLFLKGDQKA
jgi:hypothetical protein